MQRFNEQMKTDQPLSSVASSISDVERETGLAKETLRVWERRYAFPQPLRDAAGERSYPAEQVAKLRLVKRLLDLGLRPGKIMHQSMEQLQALAAPAPAAPAPGPGPVPAIQALLELCRSQQAQALRDELSQALSTMGLNRFVIDLAAPLTTLVGDAWACGQLAVFEEHLYTEALQTVMRNAIFSMPRHATQLIMPRILLTTLPQERHGLGLLMAEALCVAEGAHCLSLGVQTPLQDILEAVRTQRADILALSFSCAMNPRHVSDSLIELRAKLPAATEIWAGGNNPALHKRPIPFVHLPSLGGLQAALANWRLRQAGPM